MPRRSALFVASLLFAATAAQASDWLQWRGPAGDNHAPSGATAPVAWSETSGLAWKTPIPGRGHSSPTLVGARIYLTTADAEAGTQSLLVLDRATGELLKETVTHRGGLPPASEIHPNNTHASPTVASDGERVFALFLNRGGAYVTAYNLDGEQLWQERAGGFQPQQYKFGFGSSPRVVDGKVIVASEFDGAESGITALNATTGERAWNTPRNQLLSYSSPALASIGGREVLLMSGNYSINAYEAASGRELWNAGRVTTQATCGTMVWDEELGLAFASGGYPDVFTIAVRLGGDHGVAWQNTKVKCYEQSLLLVEGYLYAYSNRGILYCFDAATGEEKWRERLGGPVSSSPLLVDGKVYTTNEKGVMHVFRPTPDRFEPLGQNQLGDIGFATPTPGDNRLYHRYGKTGPDGRVQEYLAAIGE